MPDGVDEATVEAVGKLTEALETVERARGHLYSFHQLTGGREHLHEARLKEDRRTQGHPDHTAGP